MSKDKLVPKLRFEEFSAVWEKRTLGELGNVAMNKRIFKNQTSEKGEIPFYKIGTFGKEPDAYISRELFDEYKSKYSYPKIGDILISASGSIGRTVEYKGGDEYFQDSNIVWLNHNGKIDNHFLKQFYKIVTWHGLEGSTIKRLYNSNILNTEIILPILEEQEKIGNFFKKLDQMIQLQQSKVNKVKDIKSAYLSEMFPKEGEKYPKRRFEGFTEPWKTIKMREVFSTVLSGNRLPKTSLKGGNIPYILATTENNGVYARIDKETRDYHGNKMKIFNTPSISFSIDNPEAIFLQEENYFTSNIMRVLINNDLEKEEYIFFVETLRKATGGFNWGVKFSGPVVLDLDINVPFNKMEDKIDNQEIKKIGLFINELDEAEKLEKSKLEKLEKLKQGYLNDMFV